MKIKLTTVFVALLFLCGCSSYKESIGQYYLPVSNLTAPTREGKVCYYTRQIGETDFTVETARRKGEITNITSIEKESSVGFLFLRKTCLVVKGT